MMMERAPPTHDAETAMRPRDNDWREKGCGCFRMVFTPEINEH